MVVPVKKEVKASYIKRDPPVDYIQRNYHRKLNIYHCPCHNKEVAWFDGIPCCSITANELETLNNH